MATNNKYDRQLRLWGANGQKALSESCIILINATSAGTETLKNLVLPGVGSFHIIDDQQIIMDNNNGNKPFSNFFVFPNLGDTDDEDHVMGNDDEIHNIMKSRAEIATQHLLEMNPDVKGSFTSIPSLENANYESIFTSILQQHQTDIATDATNGDIQNNHNLMVIVADLPSKLIKPISDLCWDGFTGINKAIPLVIVKSYGLIGTVRIQTPNHTIIESKPDNFIPDLRLASIVKEVLDDSTATWINDNTNNTNTFPELLSFIQSIDLSSLENHEHGHVPFVIILFKAMEKWISDPNHGNLLPSTFAQKQEFKNIIQSMSRNYHMELNFQEAVDNASYIYTTLELPMEVNELLDNIEGIEDGKAKINSSFDVLLLALKQFMNDNNGFPPLNGSIPDMTSSTKYYIQLQNIYKTKAQRDLDEMKKIIQTIQQKQHDNVILPTVSDEELSTFCKNIYNLRLTKTRKYSSEYDFVYTSNKEREEIQDELISETFDPYASSPAQTPLLWHIALRAADAFYDEYGCYPGKESQISALENDAKVVQQKLMEIIQKMGLEENELILTTILSKEEGMENAFAKEITRYYNAEIHNIASVVGGVASQEAVKLITRQYVPIKGTFVYNGIAGVPGVYQF